MGAGLPPEAVFEPAEGLPVEIPQRGDGDAEVLAGLREGDAAEGERPEEVHPPPRRGGPGARPACGAGGRARLSLTFRCRVPKAPLLRLDGEGDGVAALPSPGLEAFAEGRAPLLTHA